MLYGGLHRDKKDIMSGATQAIRAYFFKLGLSSEIADIYLALHSHGRQTISELSRHSGVERTRVYRLLDELSRNNLIEIETRYKRSVLSAAPIGNLQILLTQKEQELRELHAGLHDLQHTLSDHALHSPATRIQAYRGSDGIKQMLWNQTRFDGENLSILYENMQNLTNLAFFERWVKATDAKETKARSIISDNFIRSQQNWYKKHTNKRMSNWEGRYVPNGVFPITHSTVIYENVTAYYNWKDGEIFGVEIHNQEIADAQRQFFEMLWNLGMSIDDLKFEFNHEDQG